MVQNRFQLFCDSHNIAVELFQIHRAVMQPTASELSKVNYLHPQQISTKLQLSNALDVSNAVGNQYYDELRLVRKYVYAESKPNVDHLRTADKFRSEMADPKPRFEAKGQTVSKFLQNIQPRALERRIKHEEVQQRREALQQEKNASRFRTKDNKVTIFFP